MATELNQLTTQVVEAWRESGDLTDQTVTRMGEIAWRFTRRLHTIGVKAAAEIDEHTCRAFIDAPTKTGEAPTTATRHFRRVTLRAYFRTARRLGHQVGDPTLDIHLPPRSDRVTRPLTDDEIVLCRTATYATRHADHRRAAAWALAEAAAMTSEIPLIRPSHIDDPTDPMHVLLPGTRRTDPRIVELTEWGAAAIARRLAHLGETDEPIVYEGAGGEVARQAAVCKLISIILESAGLTDPDIKPESVRLWRARSHYNETGDLISTARMLGNRSLDRTAEALGLDWRPR